MLHQYELIVNELSVETKGLRRSGHSELRATVADKGLISACEDFLRFVVRYLEESGKEITSGQTIPYGYWLVKFQSANGEMLDAWEYKSDASEFVEGVTLTLTYWAEQHVACDKASAAFAPPRPDKMVAISEGVYEGDPVEGVRYPSPEHMSGWWITTNRYNGNVKTLKVVHIYHLTENRPDLARYVALPPGYRFTSKPEQVWFDQKVAQ